MDFDRFDAPIGDAIGEPSGPQGAEGMLFDMMNSPERDVVFYDHRDRTAMIAGTMLAQLAEVYESNGMSRACYDRMVEEVAGVERDAEEALKYTLPKNIELGQE